MTEHQVLNEQQIEDLKRKYGIDERIAEKYNVPKELVEKDFDPRIVKLISEFLVRNL